MSCSLAACCGCLLFHASECLFCVVSDKHIRAALDDADAQKTSLGFNRRWTLQCFAAYADWAKRRHFSSLACGEPVLLLAGGCIPCASRLSERSRISLPPEPQVKRSPRKAGPSDVPSDGVSAFLPQLVAMCMSHPAIWR